MILADLSPAAERAATPLRGVKEVLGEAEASGASHVHLEPSDGAWRVRLRVAGLLIDAGAAACDADAIEALARPVARLGCSRGDRIVIRLDGGRGPEVGALADLGMPSRMLRALMPVLARPSGLVIAAGPAGAGKTTTLRAIAARLDDGTRNLLDAQGDADRLQAMIHQDPDVLLTGPLRTRQGVALAVEAALAGHLVLAEVEAPDALGAILALRTLRADRFQLASALRLVIGQRLVHQLCDGCRMPVQAPGPISALLGFDSGAVIYAPQGCAACDDSGFVGHTGVFEAIEADPALRRLVAEGGDPAILARHAFVNAPNLGSAARRLVREGLTTAEEAVRLSRT